MHEQLTAPAFAEGGVVMRRTLAIVGEAGSELIIPVSKLGGGGQATAALIAEQRETRQMLAKILAALETRPVEVKINDEVLMRANQKVARGIGARVSR